MTDDESELIRALSDLRDFAPGDELAARISGDARLERHFAEARANQPRPSDMLTARIRHGSRRARPWIEVSAWGGMVAAGVVGLTIGLSGVDLADAATVEMTPAYDFQLLAED